MGTMLESPCAHRMFPLENSKANAVASPFSRAVPTMEILVVTKGVAPEGSKLSKI
jgi:hypothetical protein